MTDRQPPSMRERTANAVAELVAEAGLRSEAATLSADRRYRSIRFRHDPSGRIGEVRVYAVSYFAVIDFQDRNLQKVFETLEDLYNFLRLRFALGGCDAAELIPTAAAARLAPPPPACPDRPPRFDGLFGAGNR